MAAKVSVSEKPWSDYTAADYSIEQWHAACLIHQHEGAPTSKGQCKLPVKTPNGTLSRAGVHAAAAALAGARGGVNASSSEKAAAAKALVRYYGQLNEEPPPSLQHGSVEKFLSHFGIKGMKWGVRRERGPAGTVSSGTSGGGEGGSGSGGGGGSAGGGHGSDETHMSVDAERFVKTTQKKGHEMSDREIKEAVNRARLVQDYDKLLGNDPNREMRQKVETLRLNKDYAQLQREMNPSKLDRAQRFIDTANKAFTAYNTLNSITGGKLGAKVNSAFTTKPKTSVNINPSKIKFKTTPVPPTTASPVFNVTTLGTGRKP